MKCFILTLLLALGIQLQVRAESMKTLSHKDSDEKAAIREQSDNQGKNAEQSIPTKKGASQPNNDDIERFSQTIKNLCGSSPLEKWQPVSFFSSGWQSVLFQVCSKERCNFLLKTVSPEEAAFSEQMGEANLGPRHHDSIPCDFVKEKHAIVMEKLDGNLFDFLFPLKNLDQVLPQVLNLIYRAITEQGVCQNDTKLTNFFYRLEGNGLPKIYLGDYGIARRCNELKDPKRENYSHMKLKSTLKEHLNLFIKSFFKPGEFGIDTEVAPLENNAMAKSFLSHLNTALQKDEKWLKYFPNVEGFNYGYLLKN